MRMAGFGPFRSRGGRGEIGGRDETLRGRVERWLGLSLHLRLDLVAIPIGAGVARVPLLLHAIHLSLLPAIPARTSDLRRRWRRVPSIAFGGWRWHMFPRERHERVLLWMGVGVVHPFRDAGLIGQVSLVCAG